MTTKPKTDFVRARRMHERGNYDEAVIHAILDAAPLCHIGHIIDGRPVDQAQHETCFGCHAAGVKDHDFVFTRLAP